MATDDKRIQYKKSTLNKGWESQDILLSEKPAVLYRVERNHIVSEVPPRQPIAINRDRFKNL